MKQQDLQSIIATLTPEIYQRLAGAVETGKWPDGTTLTSEQREHALQLVMLWQSLHNQQPQHMTISQRGEIIIKSKKQLQNEFNISKACKPEAPE